MPIVGALEQFFNQIEQCRRVATRYDNLAVNDIAFIQLVSITSMMRTNALAP